MYVIVGKMTQLSEMHKSNVTVIILRVVDIGVGKTESSYDGTTKLLYR